MVGPRGKAHGAISRCKRSSAEARGPNAGDPGPDAEAHGVWARRQGLWRLVLESEWDSCLSDKTDFEEAFTPSFDTKAQHINRGGRLEHTTSIVSCVRRPPSTVYTPGHILAVLRRSPARITSPSLSPRRRADGTHLQPRHPTRSRRRGTSPS